MKGWKRGTSRRDAFVTIGDGHAERGAVGAMFAYGKKDYYLGGIRQLAVIPCSLSDD